MAEKSKAKKIILWIAAVLVVLLLTAAALFFYLFVSISPDFKSAALSDSDYFAGARITQTVLYRAMRSKNETDVRELKISNREMHSLMRIAENADSLLYLITGAKPKMKDGKNNFYKLNYDKGVFSFKVRVRDLFGKMCFIGHGQAKLKYENGKLDISFISLKVGRYELSDAQKEKVKKYIFDYLKNNSTYSIVRSAVLKVDFVEYGNVKVWYLPYRLREHIKNAVIQ
ncbi:MAG: hypothetical protein IKB77_01205 [Lentisphaeria bacterium]|nr:hypothetical protein [Lentisphaeria bacterium]